MNLVCYVMKSCEVLIALLIFFPFLMGIEEMSYCDTKDESVFGPKMYARMTVGFLTIA